MRMRSLAVALALAAARAGAESPVPHPTLADPLARQILRRQISLPNGGITGSVRIGSGQAIELRIPELNLSLAGEPLRDAVAEPKTLSGLAPNAKLAGTQKTKSPRKARRAVDQLRAVSEQGRRARWGETGPQ